ncbi:MAG: 3-hydroxybutyryl-CoA dehydrogenase [Clostridia bacterium]|nr:MAG: 3-hydroxybutyryl-CoA dehydrogenase [Clostridia bacterium]
MALKQVCVCGAGIMGHGIAQVAAMAGLKVSLYDVSDEFAKKGVDRIAKQLNGQVEKGKMSAEERDAVVSRITPRSDLAQAAGGADFVIEAAPEKMEVKLDLFARLDQLCEPETVLASNTTALSIAEMSAATKRPDKVVGMHFFNPAQVMKLVEVIKSPNTSDETVAITVDLAKAMGKTPVTLNEFPGFIVTRILAPMINEAFYALMEGVATAEDIDTAMKLGTNFPMGPLQLADFMGLDTTLAAIRTLNREFADSKYRPCPLLVNLVRAGKLGAKTGEGVYKYGK